MTFGEERLDPAELRELPLNKRIYKIRKSLGLSQNELAERVGLDVKTVNRWENDLVQPQKESRVALERATGYPESMFKLSPPRAVAPALDIGAEVAHQLLQQSALLDTLKEAGDELREVIVELRGLIGDLREAISGADPHQQGRRPA